MKSNIHPAVQELKATCYCGASYTLHSSASITAFQRESCPKCHPIYTKRFKKVIATGKLDTFKKRYNYQTEDLHTDEKGSGDE